MATVKVIVGDEPVAAREHLRRLSAGACDVERVDAAKASPDDVMMPTLLSTEDAPVLRVVENYPKWTASQRKRFAALAVGPADGVQVAVCVKQLGAKDPLRSSVSDHDLLDASPPSAGSWERWVSAQVQARDGKIAPAAAAELVRRAGEHTATLSSEIDKLLAACDGQIELEQVRTLVDVDGVADVWAWVNAVVAGDRRTAFGALAHLHAAGESVMALTGALFSRLLPIAWVHAGCTAEQAGAKPYTWKQAQQAARSGWTAERTAQALDLLAGCEADVKGGSTLPDPALSDRLCSRLLDLHRR